MGNTVLDDRPDDDDDDVGIDLDRPTTGRGRQAPADDTDDDDADAGDGDGDDDSGAEPAAKDKKPASDKTYTQADIDKLQEANRKERENMANLRRQLRELKSAQKPAPDAEDAVAQARAAGQDEMKIVAVASKAEALLRAAGLQDAADPSRTAARIARLVKQISIEDIDVDVKTGGMDGLEDQVDALVSEFPELFTPAKSDDDEAEKPKPKRIPRGDGADRRPARRDERKLSTGELIEARVKGGR